MPTVVFKSINPSKLKLKPFQDEIEKVMKKVADGIEKDYQATVRTWKHKPEFKKRLEIEPGGPMVEVGTDDKIYGYVEYGTRPHLIQPRKPGGVLRFQEGYRAKTIPQSIGSMPGGKYGPMVSARAVHHPGTEPREFGKTIWREWLGRYRQLMTNAMKRAAKESGHAID